MKMKEIIETIGIFKFTILLIVSTYGEQYRTLMYRVVLGDKIFSI